MNNEPVAWMNEADWMGGIELDVITDEFKQSGKGGDCSEYSIPLHTHPVKELTDEEILISAQYNGIRASEILDEYVIDFARAILRKAQEK